VVLDLGFLPYTEMGHHGPWIFLSEKRFVDLPGYGFAKTPQEVAIHFRRPAGTELGWKLLKMLKVG